VPRRSGGRSAGGPTEAGVVAVAHGPAVNVADAVDAAMRAEIHPRFRFRLLPTGWVALLVMDRSYHSQRRVVDSFRRSYPMKLELTAVYEQVPEGYVAYVEELPARIPKARRWRKLVRISPRRSSLS